VPNVKRTVASSIPPRSFVPSTWTSVGAPSGRTAQPWTWNGTTWMQNDVTGASPSARAFASMASVNNAVLLFGGCEQNGCPSYLNETWTWNGTSWAQQNGPGPAARSGASMAALGDTVVLFGGNGAGGSFLGDTWTWKGSDWTEQNVIGPHARCCTSMATLGP
jgi:hypothetical protein